APANAWRSSAPSRSCRSSRSWSIHRALPPRTARRSSKRSRPAIPRRRSTPRIPLRPSPPRSSRSTVTNGATSGCSTCAGPARPIEPDADEARHLALAAQVRERMVGRVGFVGSNAGTAPIIEASFVDALRLLETHLEQRPYLFGARPAFADFALWAQVRSAFTDPTGYGIVANRTPGVLDWIARMEWPRDEGPFEDWTSLEPTLGPLLRAEI